MRTEQKTFAVGRVKVRVMARIYATRHSLSRAVKADIHGLCVDCMQHIEICISEKGLTDGTAEHEAFHAVDFSGVQGEEKKAKLLEAISQWLRGLAKHERDKR